MTKEEAKITLANLKRYMSGGGAVDKSVNKAIDMAIEALGKSEPHWIPVTEEPIPDGEYLVTWTSEIQEKPILSIICRYSGVWDCWELQLLGHQDINVLAYMELPEPYKGGTE